tara:strand:+ start:11940 stop:12248 length:309 start_codon:yes stop_codon:yes gene_type:complete
MVHVFVSQASPSVVTNVFCCSPTQNTVVLVEMLVKRAHFVHLEHVWTSAHLTHRRSVAMPASTSQKTPTIAVAATTPAKKANNASEDSVFVPLTASYVKGAV